MRRYKQSLLMVLGLIVAVSAVMALASGKDTVAAKWIRGDGGGRDGLTVDARLVQDKVLVGSDGRISLALTLTTPDVAPEDSRPEQFSDLVIVLDRSGSMSGRKLEDARQAVAQLIDRLSPRDRLALVTYANDVRTLLPLAPMDASHQETARSVVNRIAAGGGTNLGGGLYQGIQTLLGAPGAERRRRVILISDGLANQGITDPGALGEMASGAVVHNFNVSTVGVGYDFNEILMTTIADHGAGRYYFLEDPRAFAQVFEKELQSTRNVAAAGLQIRIPLAPGVRLVHAGGYPIEMQGNVATIQPGDLLAAQQRKLFLTFEVPTAQEKKWTLNNVEVRYRRNGDPHETVTDQPMQIVCVADPDAVAASIDRDAWGEQVVKEEYNQLREEVAADIRGGQKDDALRKIREYEGRQRRTNAVVQSAPVTRNLDEDVKQLRDSVKETFAGSPAAVAEKAKRQSKALQYESYQIRRDKK